MNLKADLKRLIVPMAWARAAATPTILFGIAAAALAAGAIALMMIGRSRLARITRLIAEVQAMRAASGTPAGPWSRFGSG